MDALGQVFSKLAPLLTTGSGLSKVLSGGLLGAGEVGNILEQRKRAAYQNKVMDLINNPAKLARIAASTAAPLSQGLIQNVGNTVQAQMAERGLSQAPGIFAATEAQALAPYEQQNQQVALDAFLKALGLPPGTFTNPTDLSGSMKLFLNAINPQSTPGVTPSGDMNPFNMGGPNTPPFDPTSVQVPGITP